jgi:hypothetical protein
MPELSNVYRKMLVKGIIRPRLGANVILPFIFYKHVNPLGLIGNIGMCLNVKFNKLFY